MAHVPYANVVGSLTYATVCSRPYIAHAMRVLCRYMWTPRKEHWIVVNRVFKYSRRTKNVAICYQGKPENDRKLTYMALLFL